MNPAILPLPFDPARLHGLSEKLLQSHHQNNYGGAVWRDPETVDEWAGELAGKEVVVYCVYGHEVGQSTAARLRDAGVSARYLTGGIVDWKAAGLPLKAK